MIEPTDLDRENAELRARIAARQNAAYAEAAFLALAACGPGWRPWMRLDLIPSDHRQTGDSTPVATVVKAYRGEDKLTENSVFIRRMQDGSIRKATRYEELFGDLLHEKHTTKTFEYRGQQIPAERYELVWGALEEYHPRDAARLAQLRQSREEKKSAREEASFREQNPLFTTWAEQNARQQGDEQPTASVEPIVELDKPPVQRGLFG